VSLAEDAQNGIVDRLDGGRQPSSSAGRQAASWPPLSG
jgi:hypothetical protein